MWTALLWDTWKKRREGVDRAVEGVSRKVLVSVNQALRFLPEKRNEYEQCFRLWGQSQLHGSTVAVLGSEHVRPPGFILGFKVQQIVDIKHMRNAEYHEVKELKEFTLLLIY